MKMLEVSLECPIVEIESVGLDGDMLEAQVFAYLAVRAARGLPQYHRRSGSSFWWNFKLFKHLIKNAEFQNPARLR
jgi:1,6-anhydro-N-acetylmuramate kinase